MPKKGNHIVINTGPILALVAGTGGLGILEQLFEKVVVPFEVQNEILQGSTNFAKDEFAAARFLRKAKKEIVVSKFLKNSLDAGESAVIQTALDLNIQAVCIDESVGRRIARLHDLKLTGSIGVLIAAKQKGYIPSVAVSLGNMKAAGIWISDKLCAEAIALAGE